MQKFILAYQRNIQHKPAFTAMFGEAFMNWEYVERNPPKLDCPHWMAFFKYFNFERVCRKGSILRDIERHLAKLGMGPELVCQIFLLKNMNFIAAQLGVERLFCEYEIPDAHTKSMRFFAMSADTAFDMQETTAVFCHIMQTCEINEAEVEKQMQFVSLREEELSESFRVKQIRVVGGRPRLRSKLAAIQKDVKSLGDVDSFNAWSSMIGFPSVFALHIRHRLYFLMSQPNIPDPMLHVPDITRDMYIQNALKSATVQKPESEIIYKVIASMRLTENPFKELHEFRTECMNAFPSSQVASMLLNDALHLYVCAYQHPMIWKDIWKQLVPLLSHQVIRDVETFTAKRPFNFAAVLGIMNG